MTYVAREVFRLNHVVIKVIRSGLGNTSDLQIGGVKCCTPGVIVCVSGNHYEEIFKL